VLCSFGRSQAFHHLEKDALVAPAFPAIIKRLGRAIFLRRIAPPEPVAIDEDDAAQNASIINALATMALGEIGLKTCHLLVRQPNKLLISLAPRRLSESKPFLQINEARA